MRSNQLLILRTRNLVPERTRNQKLSLECHCRHSGTRGMHRVRCIQHNEQQASDILAQILCRQYYAGGPNLNCWVVGTLALSGVFCLFLHKTIKTKADRVRPMFSIKCWFVKNVPSSFPLHIMKMFRKEQSLGCAERFWKRRISQILNHG